MSFLNKNRAFDYFDGFSKIAQHGTDCAIKLNSAMESFDYSKLSENVSDIHEIEHAADSDKHEIMEHLAREFVTPIELEDIIALCQCLDTVVDSIDEVMRRLYVYDVKQIRPEMTEFTSLIVKISEKLQETVKEFKNYKTSKTIKDMIIAVNTFESEGDSLHTKYTHKLFSENADSKEILVWSTLFETLEECYDACEDAADVIESVIMKNT